MGRIIIVMLNVDEDVNRKTITCLNDAGTRNSDKKLSGVKETAVNNQARTYYILEIKYHCCIGIGIKD